MELVTPSPEYVAGYIAALERGWSPDTTRGIEGAQEALAKFKADPNSLYGVVDDPQGKGPAWTGPDGVSRPRLPGRLRWIWDADEGGDGFAGTINLRWMRGHRPLPEFVLGHAGYSVVAWKHKRGYATKALAMLLPMARAEGMPFVDLTTDIGNEASQKVIRANGGVLVGEFIKPAMWGAKPSLRFRITL
jgi:predicted acetyltransferase